MSDALTPLRHAYGVEPDGAPAPDERGAPELEALRQMRALLDDWPAPAPPAEVRAAVEARAAAVAAVIADTEAAVARALADRPRPRPSDATLEAVLARAAEATDAVGLEARSPVEAAVLDQSLAALDRLPTRRPPAAVIAAVEARAAEASGGLEAVRHVYLDGPGVAGAEAALLAQTREAVERALASRPQPRPSMEALEAVAARAAEASGLEPEPVLEVPVVEGAVFAQSLRALDRLPMRRPAPETLDAVRLAAATASAAGTQAAPAREARPAPRADRAPVGPNRRRAPVGVWAGAAGLLLAALAAVFVLPFGGPSAEEAATVAALAEPEEASVVPVPEADPAEESVEAPEPDPVGLPAGGGLAAAATISGFVPVAEAAPRASRSQASTAAPRASTPPSAAPRPTAPAETPAWEPADDVRALSLRLQELESEDALAWDEPAETFGVPASRSAAPTPGVQAVRAGAPPARVRLRPDTTSVQR